MLRTPHRVIAVSAFATCAAAAFIAPAAHAASGMPITGGNVKIVLSHSASKAFDEAGITVDATGTASFKKDTLKLPVTGGNASPPDFGPKLGGGVSFSIGRESIKVTHLKISSDEEVATASATGKIGKAHLSNVLLFSSPAGGNGGPGEVQFGYDSVSLTKSAQNKLDAALSTKFFAKHPSLGASFFDLKYDAS